VVQDAENGGVPGVLGRFAGRDAVGVGLVDVDDRQPSQVLDDVRVASLAGEPTARGEQEVSETKA